MKLLVTGVVAALLASCAPLPSPRAAENPSVTASALTPTASAVAADPSAQPVAPSASAASATPAPSAAPRTVTNPYDARYQPGFRLTPLSADPVTPVTRPARLGDAFTDPAYGTWITRATDAAHGQGGRMRHEYSRRQAFNADNTRYLTQDGTGYWYLNDAATFTPLGLVEGMAGDCEPLWHPTDPNRLYLTSRGGGTTWWLLDVETGAKQVVYDFAADPVFPQATSYWTKGEGTTSADGRYLALVATSYDAATKQVSAHGLVMLDLVDRRVVGSLPASRFPIPGALPDHVSTAPSGRYAVVSWLAGDGGTHAFSADFTSSRQLAAGSEHSDLAVGADGRDQLVYADYGAGVIRAIDVATAESIPLHTLYPAQGEAYAVHLSGQAFDRPGWVVVSTYADSAAYGDERPAATLRAEYRKVWLLRTDGSGTALDVAHVRSDPSRLVGDAYFLEPQASVSRDLSRIIVATNIGPGNVESYIIGLPSWVV